MPRLRIRELREVNELDLEMALLIGPITSDGLTDEELAVGWQLHRDRIMGQWFTPPSRAGCRPWGYWRFEVGEDMPRGDWRSHAVEDRQAEPLRLAELGLLTAGEVAAFCERANEARLRIGTPGERFSHVTPVDQLDVALYAAILERLP
jgi:hypothetical protein